jgi:hypothetical protein
MGIRRCTLPLWAWTNKNGSLYGLANIKALLSTRMRNCLLRVFTHAYWIAHMYESV